MEINKETERELEMKLDEILTDIDLISNLSKSAMEKARQRQEILAKPTGALGQLEEISIRLAGITGQVNNDMKKQAIAIFCADNGVVEEGVASAPQSVTRSQTINFTKRKTGVGSMAEYFHIDLLVVDMGIKLPIPEELYCPEMTEHQCSDVVGGCQQGLAKRIVNRRIAAGTKNLAKEAAMSRQEALRAIFAGFEAVEAIKRCGHNVFGIGEMGIGNTTTSACVLAALLQKPAEEIVGRGGGLNDEGLRKKTEIVKHAAASCSGCDVVDILARIGGFDLCAMTGAYLGAAYYKIPVVIDGFISAVAAAAAVKLAPKTASFLFGSHISQERGYAIAMESLGIRPYFDLSMRLGEGSGCPLAFKLLETACAAMNGMATFEEGEIEADYLEEGKKGNFF